METSRLPERERPAAGPWAPTGQLLTRVGGGSKKEREREGKRGHKETEREKQK